MSSKVILYTNWRSSCSWRVRIGLQLKQIPHELKEVSILRRSVDPISTNFREINPMGQVPILIIDNQTLIESMSILEYLEETRHQNPLMPSDPTERAKVREICQVIISGIQPLHNFSSLKRYVTGGKWPKWAKSRITKKFRALEKLLSICSKRYCVGDKITLADCCLIPQTYVAKRYDVDISEFPSISRIYKDLERHPAFENTHPKNQPVSPSIASLFNLER